MYSVKRILIGLVILTLISLTSTNKVLASVTSVKGYSSPEGGQDKFTFDVYVPSADEYPICSVTAKYNDGSPSYSTRGVATFSTNISPSKPSIVTVTCEGISASVAFAGNTYPFAGDINRKVGTNPTAIKSPIPKPTIKPSPSPTLVSPSPELEIPKAEVVEKSGEGNLPAWIKNMSPSPLKRLLEFIFGIFS